MSTDIEVAVKDYVDSGDPIKVVATRHHVGRDRLWRAIKAADVMRPRGPSHPPAVRDAALADYRGGMAIHAVSIKHAVSRHILNTWLEQDYGKPGDSPAVLTGGRWVRDGLVSRWQVDGAA